MGHVMHSTAPLVVGRKTPAALTSDALAHPDVELSTTGAAVQDGGDKDANPPGDLPEKGHEHLGADKAREGGLLEGFRGMVDAQSAQVGEAARESDLDVRL